MIAMDLCLGRRAGRNELIGAACLRNAVVEREPKPEEVKRAGAADEPPTFDIDRICSREMASAGVPDSCKGDETQAKNQLAKRWSSYSESQKKECVAESGIGGEKSYVELLTCLQMMTGKITPDPHQ
jgi:hypothetical protein